MLFQDLHIYCIYRYSVAYFPGLDGGDGCQVNSSCLLARTGTVMAYHANVFSICIREESHSGH